MTNPFFEVPSIGQGTWDMERTRSESVRALVKGLELGLVHIDTAEMYGDGACEEICADALRQWGGRRDDVFLVTKVLPSNASRTGTRKALEQSLRRLKTDFVDCYLLHWRSRFPLEETLAALLELKREGKTRQIGVSNFDEHDIEECVRITGAGAGAIACNQVLYHLEERAIEHAVIPTCERHGIAVVAYSPFGSGQFPTRTAVLDDIAARHGATARQVALAFLTRKDGVLAIPKASRVAHVEDNAGALHLELSADDISAIDAAFPLGKKPRSLPTI